MADDTYGFNATDTARIVKTVRHDERTAIPKRNWRPPDLRTVPDFWAELTGEGSEDGWYDWKLVYPDPTDDTGWKDADPAVTGTSNARESSDTPGLYSADTPRRVQMRYVGRDDDGNAVYVFSAGGVSSKGQYQYMNHTMTAQNEDGWEFTKAHPVLSPV